MRKRVFIVAFLFFLGIVYIGPANKAEAAGTKNWKQLYKEFLENNMDRIYNCEKGMKRVMLGCYKDNLASAATIKKNKGILLFEADNYNEGRISQYYSVDL